MYYLWPESKIRNSANTNCYRIAGILAIIKFGRLGPKRRFHTIQDLNLAVWYGIGIRTCAQKKNLADFNLAV